MAGDHLETRPVKPSVTIFHALLVGAGIVAANCAPAAELEPRPEPVQRIAVFYSQHCVQCHRGSKAKGSFRMDALLSEATIGARADSWKNVLDRLLARDMPPHDEKDRPAEADYEKQIEWLRTELGKHEAITARAKPRYLRRLNRVEYARTLRELFGVDVHPGDDLPPDDALHGFDTVAEGQSLSAVHVEQLVKTADRVIEAAFREEPWPGLLRSQVFTPRQNPDDFGCSIMWGFKSPQGTLWTFRAIGPGGYGTVPVSGMYRARFKLVPHHLQGAPGKVETPPGRLPLHDFTGPSVPHLVGTFAGREVLEMHIPPEQEGREITVDLLGWLDRGTEVSEIELRYVNGTPGDGGLLKRGLSDHPPGLPDTPDRMPKDFPFLLVKEKSLTGPLQEFWRSPQVQTVIAAGEGVGDPARSLAVLLPQAFRRPVGREEIEFYATAAREEIARGASFLAGLKVALKAVLTAPDFLFVVEKAPPGAPRGSYRLDDYELATRLSLFLHSSAPDQALLAAAARGELRDPVRRAAWVTRRLADPRTHDALAGHFVPQWLGLARLASAMPERSLFPEFNWPDEMYEFYGTRLLASMRREPGAFFRQALAENAPLTDFLASDYVVLDENLARLYDVPGVVGGSFRRVLLPESQRGRRGGLLGMAAILTSTSEATRTSPVIRGTWLLKKIFNRPPPPPPPNAGAIEPDTGAARSLREKLALHREAPNCAGCHARIDPYGLALENYNAIGRWRDAEPAWYDPARPELKPAAGPDGRPVLFPIDATTTLANGRRLAGLPDLKNHLLERKDDFVRGLAEKLIIYATGRGLLVSDARDVDRIVAATKAGDYRLHALLRAVVDSEAFLTR